MLNETNSVLLRTDAMVMRPFIALCYVSAWSRKYLVTSAIGPYGLYKREARGRAAPECRVQTSAPVTKELNVQIYICCYRVTDRQTAMLTIPLTRTQVVIRSGGLQSLLGGNSPNDDSRGR